MKLKTLLVILSMATTSSLACIATASAQEKTTQASAVVSIVNINTADEATLTTLPGIGLKKAESIVTYRELNGKFQSVDELSNVKGIGKRMVERLADKVSV